MVRVPRRKIPPIAAAPARDAPNRAPAYQQSEFVPPLTCKLV